MGRDPLRPCWWYRWRTNGGEEWRILREKFCIVPPEIIKTWFPDKEFVNGVWKSIDKVE